MRERRHDETLCLTNTEFWNFFFVKKEKDVEHTQKLRFQSSFALPKKKNHAVHKIWGDRYLVQTTKNFDTHEQIPKKDLYGHTPKMTIWW